MCSLTLKQYSLRKKAYVTLQQTRKGKFASTIWKVNSCTLYPHVSYKHHYHPSWMTPGSSSTFPKYLCTLETSASLLPLNVMEAQVSTPFTTRSICLAISCSVVSLTVPIAFHSALPTQAYSVSQSLVTTLKHSSFPLPYTYTFLFQSQYVHIPTLVHGHPQTWANARSSIPTAPLNLLFRQQTAAAPVQGVLDQSFSVKSVQRTSRNLKRHINGPFLIHQPPWAPPHHLCSPFRHIQSLASQINCVPSHVPQSITISHISPLDCGPDFNAPPSQWDPTMLPLNDSLIFYTSLQGHDYDNAWGMSDSR